MQTQSETVQDFIRGFNGSKASNLKTVELDDGRTALVGYDLAIYAIKEGNEIKVFLGWDGRSKSTDEHMRLLRRAVEERSAVYMTGIGGKKSL